LEINPDYEQAKKDIGKKLYELIKKFRDKNNLKYNRTHSIKNEAKTIKSILKIKN
jgi:hypothetical protein